MKDSYKELSDFIVDYRRENNLSQLDLAKQLRVSRSYVSNVEGDLVSRNSVAFAKKLIKKLNAPMASLLKKTMLNILFKGVIK